jgi:hypothetical protein
MTLQVAWISALLSFCQRQMGEIVESLLAGFTTPFTDTAYYSLYVPGCVSTKNNLDVLLAFGALSS